MPGWDDLPEKHPSPPSNEMLLEDIASFVEALRQQKTIIETIQGLLDDLYPGLRVQNSMLGYTINGPKIVLDRLARDMNRASTHTQSSDHRN